MSSDSRLHAPDPDRERFQARLRDALRLEAQRSGGRPGPALLRAALDEPPSDHRLRPWPLAGAVAAAAAVLLAVLILSPGSHGPSAAQASGANASLATPASSEPTPAIPPAVPPPVTLADCQIYPADASLAFSGWATTSVLQVSGGHAQPGQPVYALVTRGLAEWMGWRSPGAGPIFPPPVGRMGCIYDPSTGEASLIGVPVDWQPPAMIDGCPGSPEDAFAGYREIGGPQAWALLPTGPNGWVAGNQALILYRISPPPAGDQAVTAWAVPLEGGARVGGAVGITVTPVPSPGPLPTPGQSELRYYVVDQLLPAAGCWVLNVAVGGQLAGSAIIAIPAPEASGLGS
jgi:hypothetical protein